MDIRSLTLNELYDLYNEYKTSKKMSYIKKLDKKNVIKQILHLLIYPIKIPDKELSMERFKIDLLKSPRIYINNFNVPNGLYMNKICNHDNEQKLINEFNSFFLKLKGKNFFKNEINLYESSDSNGFKGLREIFNNNKIIITLLSNIISQLFYNLYKPYKKDFIDKNIIKNSKITILYYSQKNNIFKGVKHHIDSYAHHQGCISVITFNNSVLDFIPFIELKDKLPFRIMFPKNYAITFDGNLRYYYSHGVPFNLNYDNDYRYAINIRHPNFKDKLVPTNNNCDLFEEFEKNTIYDCNQTIPIKSISLE